MRTWPAVLLPALLFGQEAKPVPKPGPGTPAQRLQLRATLLTPQAMIRAMVALDQAQRNQPGAVVEVIGYNDEATLNLMVLTLVEQVRQEFHIMDQQGHRELYAFMHQNPSQPNLAQATPMLVGGKVSRPEDKYLR